MIVLEQDRHLDPDRLVGDSILCPMVQSILVAASSKRRRWHLSAAWPASDCRDRALEAEDRRLLRRQGARTDAEQDPGVVQLEAVLIRPGQCVMEKGFEKGD
jgi:hypothetical protein